MHGYTLGQKDGTNALWDKKDVGTLQDRRKDVGTLWDRKDVGQKERCAWVHFGTERWLQCTMGQKGCGYTTGQKERCGYTMGQKDGTNALWDKKDVGTLWDRRKG